MIKAVIFDMFETLVTHYRSPQYFGEDIAKDLGLSEEKFREIWDQTDYDRSVGHRTFEDVIKEIMEKNGIWSDQLLKKVSQRRTMSKVDVFLHMHEEILPLLDELKRRDIKIGLISNCYLEEVFAIRGSKLYPYFDACMLSYEQGVMKPDKEIYSRCLKKLNVSALECLYVGDGGSKELETATEMGMKALQAAWYFKDNTRKPPTRDFRFSVMESPLEILQYLFFFYVLFGTQEPLRFRECDRQGIDLELQMQFRGSVGVYGFDVDHYFGEKDITEGVKNQASKIVQYGLEHWSLEKSILQSDTGDMLRQMLEKGFSDIGIKVKVETFTWQLTEESQKLYAARKPLSSNVSGGDGEASLNTDVKENSPVGILEDFEVLRAQEEWQRAGAYSVRIQGMNRQHHISLRDEFDEHDGGGTKYIVLLDKGYPIATCRFYELSARRVTIGRVVVLPEYRGRHLGARVVREAEKWIADCGYAEIEVDSRVNAIGFYEKLGYAKMCDDVIQSGVFECVKMQKNW